MQTNNNSSTIRQTNWVYILKQFQSLWRKKIAVH